MAPSDDVPNPEETRLDHLHAIGPESGPSPVRNGRLADSVNPFYLAIAELQAETDDQGQVPSHLAAPETLPPQGIMLAQPTGALGLGNFVMIGVIALTCGLLGGTIATKALGTRPSQKTDQGAAAASPADAALARSVEEQKSRTSQLAKRIDSQDEALAALSKSVPPSESSRSREDADKLGKLSDRLTFVEARLEELKGRDDGLNEAIGTVRTEIGVVRQKLDAVELLNAARTTAPTDTNKRDEKSANERGLIQGAELFRNGKYKDALGVFNKLELSNPDDARVWYYAALCYGLLTNHWEGSTAELVMKGIERERAGTPDSGQIDAAFKDLTETTGKTWLEEYRKHAHERSAPPAN